MPLSSECTLQTIDDATDEPNGTVAATLQAGAGHAVNDPSVAYTNVIDNDGLEDGAWYWLNEGRLATGPPKRDGTGISTAVPLVRRESAAGVLAEPVVPHGVDARPGPLGTLFTRGRLMGVVPRVQTPEQR